MDSVLIIGGGGHAKVVASTLIASGIKISGIIDDDEKKWGQHIFNIPIAGLQQYGDISNKKAVIAIGDNSIRKRIAEHMKNVIWETVVHPHSYVHPSASIGLGTVVFAGAVVQPDAVIGEHCIINSNSSIDHDCVIGNFAHIGPGASLAGNVSVREGAFLGIGTVVIVGKKIGQWATLGAGSVVVTDVDDRVTAVGIPAKPIER